MSMPITSTAALRVSGLSIAVSGFTADIFMSFWIKVADSGGSDYLKAFQMHSDDGAGSEPRMSLNCYPNRNPWADASRSGGSTFDVINSTHQIANNTWAFVWLEWNASDGSFDCGTGTNSVNGSGPSDWVSSGGTIKTISLGMWKSHNGTTDEFSTHNYKIALPSIAKRAPTRGVGSELEDLAAGAHPHAIFGSSLLDYWGPDSKVSGINGWTFSDVGGTITPDTGDNPSVDDPPAGGGGGSSPPIIIFMG